MGNKTLRVSVNPRMLRWARERAALGVQDLIKDFPKLQAWEAGEVRPTLKQLERFAQKTRVPFGYFFLEAPPDEPLPIPDFRIMPQEQRRPPSPDMLEVIYQCQRRQEWYRDYVQRLGEPPLSFVKSAALTNDTVEVAAAIRHQLQFDVEERSGIRAWQEALRSFVESVEEVGVLVMISGIVGSNTHRKLDPEEFRGLALVDDLAPLIFINGADTKSAQMFTLAHELAHIWLGQSGISDPQLGRPTDQSVERWCNQVAAEVLVPMTKLEEVYRPDRPLEEELERLARYFKVSTLVVLRRLYDTGVLEWKDFREMYEVQLGRLRRFERTSRGAGGDFYLNLKTRVGKRFAAAVIISALEGQTLLRDAYQMLGIRKHEMLLKLAHKLEVA